MFVKDLRQQIFVKGIPRQVYWGFPGGSAVKNPPEMQEPQEEWVWSLGGEDPLEEGMETHSSILAWRIPRTEEPGGLQSIELKSVRHDWSDWAHRHVYACFLLDSLVFIFIFR